MCLACWLQLIQGKLADMYAATQATRAFIYNTARDADAGKPCGCSVARCGEKHKIDACRDICHAHA